MDVMNLMPSWFSGAFLALNGVLGLHLPLELALLVWAVILFTSVTVLGKASVIFMVLMERKVLAWLTQRKGPNRTGPWGLLQTLADGVKLLFKEDIMTPQQDKFLFSLAPAVFFLPVFVILALVPFTDQLQAVPLPSAGLLVFALSSISVIGLVLAGWASNNKYSLIGGMRSAAQAISYEIPLVMAVLAVVVATGSMDLKTIIEAQNGPFWHWFYISITPISFLIFWVASIAEVNRIPFDLPEAESELVSGYNTEYSGMKFALFFLAEYAALFGMSALIAVFFFGGYYSPFGGLITDHLGVVKLLDSSLSGLGGMVAQLEKVFWMLSKTYTFIFTAMWLRGTLPRLKPDQLMAFSWKFLIPLSLLNLVLVAFQKYYWMEGSLASLILWACTVVLGLALFANVMSRLFTKQMEQRFLPSPLKS
jgi:NADH-quinone oxidoreductase subunit H